MPLYEYHCNDCGAEFEKMMRFSEADHIPECPACDSSETQKKLSRVVSFGTPDSASVNTSASNCGSRGGFT